MRIIYSMCDKFHGIISRVFTIILINIYYLMNTTHFCELNSSSNCMRKHAIQAKNVNKCNTYFLSGEIKELLCRQHSSVSIRRHMKSR